MVCGANLYVSQHIVIAFWIDVYHPDCLLLEFPQTLSTKCPATFQKNGLTKEPDVVRVRLMWKRFVVV